MEQEVMETVLNEILDEIKFIQQQNAASDKEADEIKNKLQLIEKKLSAIDNKATAVNHQAILQVLNDQVGRLNLKLDAQPKNVIHKKQILLFPEQGAREYYRIVFGRLIFWLIIILITSYLFALGKQFIDNWKEVKEKQVNVVVIRGTTIQESKPHNKSKKAK